MDGIVHEISLPHFYGKICKASEALLQSGVTKNTSVSMGLQTRLKVDSRT